MSSNGKWEKVVATNKSLTGLKQVSMVCLNGTLLLRHKDLKEQPFIVFNCDTLEEVPAESQITSEGPMYTRLDYSVEELPNET